MKFWRVTVFNSFIKSDEEFGVACDNSYDQNRVREILLSAHPEYEQVSIEESKEPKNWTWSDK